MIDPVPAPRRTASGSSCAAGWHVLRSGFCITAVLAAQPRQLTGGIEMNPQRSEKKKETGRSQKGFERSRKPTPAHGQEHHRQEGPGGQHQQPDDELDYEEKDTE